MQWHESFTKGLRDKSILKKSILDKINNKLRNTTRLNHWKDTSEVINWFNKIEKSKHAFIVFDIKDFYCQSPNISYKKPLSLPKQKYL